MKLDAFCHILPKPYFDRLQEISTERAANLLRRTAPIKHLWDLDERFRLMDDFGEYQQILSLAAPPIESLGDASLASELATLANDELAELVRSHPDRFPAFIAGLPMNDVDAALGEIDRAVGEMGAVGVQFYTHMNGEPLDDETIATSRCTRAWRSSTGPSGFTPRATRPGRTIRARRSRSSRSGGCSAGLTTRRCSWRASFSPA
jgi:predicted TIM-barrel fold metal-dependent hydrolase